MTTTEFVCPYANNLFVNLFQAEINFLIDIGYSEEDAEVVSRYYEMTGCQRFLAAVSPDDECNDRRHHLVGRQWRRNSEGMYVEVAETTNQALIGRKLITPGLDNLSQTAVNVALLADYEPDRTQAPISKEGDFLFATIFDLWSNDTGQFHPAKFVVRYKPYGQGEVGSISRMTFSVFNINDDGESTRYYTKVEIIPQIDDLTGETTFSSRVLFNSADLAPDTVGKPQPSLRGQVLSAKGGVVTSVQNRVISDTPDGDLLVMREGTTTTEEFHVTWSGIVEPLDAIRNRVHGSPYFQTPVTVEMNEDGASILTEVCSWHFARWMVETFGGLKAMKPSDMTDQNALQILNSFTPQYMNLVNSLNFGADNCGNLKIVNNST